jgi:hypothetical protein
MGTPSPWVFRPSGDPQVTLYLWSVFRFPLRPISPSTERAGPDEGFIDALNLHTSITSGVRVRTILTGSRISTWTGIQAISLNHVRPGYLFSSTGTLPEQTFTQHATVPSFLSIEGKLLLYSHRLSETAPRSKK